MSTLEDAIRITISGMPHPQPRPRWVAGQGMVSTLAPRVKTWRMRVARAISDAAFDVGEAVIERMHEGCLSLSLQFNIPAPADKKTWIGLAHHRTPDTDNLAKPIMDELQNAKMLPDDGRIAELIVRKVWCKPADGGCTLVLKPLPAAYVGVRHADMPRWLEEAVIGGGK